MLGEPRHGQKPAHISSTHFSIYGVQAVIPAAGLATAVEPLGDNLVRAWHFNNTTKEWAFYDPRPIFSESNTLEDLVPGDAYFVGVNSDQTAVLNDKVQFLYAGWNLIAW